VGLAQHPPPPQQQQQQHVLLPQAVVLQFPCPVCQVVFPAQDLLEAHAKTHSQRNKCPVCALTFPKASPPSHRCTFCQGCGFIFIWYESGSGSSILGWIPIRIQSGSRVLMTKNCKKFTAGKKINFLRIKNYNLPSPRPPKRTSKLQKKPSALKKEHIGLQNMKFLIFFYFCGSSLPSWIRFRIRIRIHWPDWIRIQFGSGSGTLHILYALGSGWKLSWFSDPLFYFYKFKT
jgi:hypothetical protein